MSKIIKIIKIALYLIAVNSLTLPLIALGQPAGNTTGGAPSILNPISAAGDLTEFVSIVLDKIVLPVGAVVAVIFIIYTGFLFVIAQGKPEALDKAKKAFLWTSIGTAVLLGSWVIAQAINSTVASIRNV